MKKFTLYLSSELHAALEKAAMQKRDKTGKGRASITAIVTADLEKKYLPKKAA